MNFSYSQKLIAECQKVFEKKTGRTITAQEADEFLDCLARLGKLAVENFKGEEVENG